jgi:predicted MFS family arabinose efflux permease
VLPALRARLGLDLLLRCGTVYGVVNLAVLALVDSTPVVVASLVVAGAAWIAVLSSLNTAAQLAAPDRVRGRALALNQAVLSGGMASGALLWGVVAELAGLQTALLVAAGVLLATLAGARRWPLDRRGL